MTNPQRYRRRPVEVEALQYTAETCEAWHEWRGEEHGRPGCACTPNDRVGPPDALGRWNVCIPDKHGSEFPDYEWVDQIDFHAEYEPVDPPAITPALNGTLTLDNGWRVEHDENAGQDGDQCWRDESSLRVTRGDGRWLDLMDDDDATLVAWNQPSGGYGITRITDAEHALLVRIAEAYGVTT